jgi:hypothetical protein
MTQPRDPGDAPDPNESPSPTGPTPPAPPPYAPGDPAAYPPPGPVGYTPPGPGPEGYTPPPPAGPQGELAQTGPMGYTPPPAPPVKKTNWLGIGILLLIVAGIIIAFILFRDRLGGAVEDLTVGDCFDEPSLMTDIKEVQHQPCNSPHDGEVIASLVNPAGPDEAYPVVSGFEDYVVQNCVPIFQSYTGRDYDTDTELGLSWLQPTLSSWGAGDRGFTCYVKKLDGNKMSGSVRGIGGSPLP